MPKYIVNGKTYNIPDNKVDGFENKYPDAEVEYYNEGKKYLIPIGKRDGFLKKFPNASYDGNSEIANTSQQPTSTLKSAELFNVIPVKDSTAERDETYSITNPSQSASAEQPYAEHRVPTYGEGEYATGFGQGFKQGWKGLKEGVKYFVGETANLISGSSQDDVGALKRFDELQQSGQELQQPLLSRKDRRYHKQMSGAENVTVPMEFQYDEKGMPIPGTGRVLTEEEKQKHRDILQNDEYNQLISDAIAAAGGDLSQARRILAARAEDKTWGDRLMESASEEMAKIKPTKGFGAWVGNLIPQMIPSASAMMLSVVTKNPKYLKYIGGLGMGTMSVSTAGQSMKEARDAGADNAQVWAVGLTNAAIDYATEKIPFDRYTTRLFNGTKKNVAQELSEAVADNTSPARAELEKLLIAANKKLGGRLLNGKNVKDFAGDILAEGVSEFTAEALQTITPMIYENPEDYPTISEIINNGWEGAKAGLFMGSVLGGASKTLEHRQNRSRRKQQGYVDVVQVATNQDGISDIGEVIGVKDNGNLSVLIDGSVEEVAPHMVQERHKFTFDEFDKAELQMEMDESYDNGYSLSTPQEMNDAQNTYDLQREKALSLFYEEVLDKIDANPIVYLDSYSGKKRDVLLDYINAKQVRDGMIQRVRDDIDSRIEESNTMVDSRTNTDTGMIQGATMKVDDRKVYVVKGNLVQYDDKSGINNSASSESVIIRDAQTGKIEIVSPDAILNIDDAIDPNEEKATAAEVIRTTYAREEADKMEGILTFNPGDTYTLDTENGQMQVQITANEQGIVDNGDGTINVTDGQNIFPVTKQTFQDQVDAANKARVAQYDALRQAERSMGNTPEYALNDKVVLRDADGNTINGQIAEVFADDGYYIVDVDVPINGSYAARMTRDELNNMLVEHNGVNVNTPSVPAQQAQSTPVAPTLSQQAQTPAAPQNNTALSRIPKDAQGNPIYEQTDADTAWDAIVEQTEGDEAMAQSVAESMLKDKQTALSKAEKMQVKGGVTIAEKIAAEKERKAIIDNAQREVELWQQIAGTVQRRQAAAEVQRKIEEEKRRIAEEAAAQQAKVEEEQSQVQTNQEELAVEDSEQEVADVAPESEEKIDDSTIGEQITEQETPVQAEEQVQSEESPAESQVTEQAETPTSAQPKESKKAKKLRKRAEKWMKDTGVTVRLLHSIDEVTNKSARAVIEAGNPVSGWFSNNEVVLYMPNINSVEGVDKTFIHEAVAHKGLRMLMGEQFDALCDNVWDMMSEEDRAKYIKYPGVKGNTRKAADEYMAYLAEGVDLNRTIWQKIIDAVREFFSSKDVRLLDEEIANLIKESYKNLKAQAATNVDNEVASIDGNDAMFSIKTYREGGRDILQKFLKGRVKVKDLTKAEAEEMLNQMDEIYAICEEFKDKYAPFGNWSEAAVVVDEDGKPVFSVIKPNGDYAMNLDFSLVCKKRRTLDAVFREMINRGIISDYDLGQVDIAKINDIIRKYGFETACRLCFVDAKRFRVAMVADAFVGIYNPLTKMTDQQLNNVSKQMGDATEGKIARMLLKNPQNRIQLSRDNFMDSKGFEDIKANKAEIMSLYNAKKGTGGPKAALGDVQYLNDILKKRWSPKTAYSVGGVRLQSFSDYVPRMVFDYIQMIADLAAKKLPVHSYTKEVLFAQTFGLTGMKINLSLVPKVVEGGVAPGLDAEGNYAWQEGETFPYEEAMRLQNAEGYKENCGTIAVGVSDEHIQKLLDDDNIRMVIPYHKSGLNKQVAIHNNIDQFVDYTNEQNTRNADGKKLSEEQAKKHFNFNSDLHKHGNPRKAAENYLEWCRKNDYLPKFDKFQNHPNYYKLLEDFTTCITENGVDTFVPQGAVKMNFPTNESAFGSLSELIERGLEEDAILEGMKSEKIGPIVDDIQKALDEGQTMFRVANNNQEIFVSNARKAVESIKQEKATPEQWLAMLQKNGGLKAGEDKWLGLSEWLNGKQGSVTKQEILDFITENKIVIEEVKYGGKNMTKEDIKNTPEYKALVDDLSETDENGNTFISEERYDYLVKETFDFKQGFKLEDGQLEIKNPYAAKLYLDIAPKIIHGTRLDYTTKGLKNKAEIALTVPAVEPYNQNDEVHFGDAGGGRAVAWVRSGETTDSEGNRVLVIDEIQSKRHQDGREKGYRSDAKIAELKSKADSLVAEQEQIAKDILHKQGYIFHDEEIGRFSEKHEYDALTGRIGSQEQMARQKEIDLELYVINHELRGLYNGIPDAPFEKNWHELAMKRMLRLAAEEGFDKVAWTTGEQQAQRYNISSQVESISVEENITEQFSDGTPVAKNITISTANGMDIRINTDAEGVIHGGEYGGKHLSDVVGKEIAEKIIQPGSFTLEGEGLRIGGEGMKSFYDKMIPSFVSKYTKKWGAKVGEVTMPNLEENNTMWSVNITPEMQESVMEGQTMFRISEEQDKAYIDAVEAGDMETAQAMVDSAAQAVGYNSPRLYHGTKSEFNVFNAKHNDPGSKGFFFTDSEEMASSYGKNIKQVYLRVEDPYVIEGNGRNWNNLHTDIFSVIPEIEDQIRAHEIAMKRFLENGDIKQSQYDYFRDKYYNKVDFIKDESKNTIFDIIKKYIYRWQIRNFNSKLNVDRTRDFEWLLQQLDSDVNIIFKDITDYGANITDYESIFTPHDVYVTTNPKNIKSADAVTYDDNGNIIPLSERFNEENDDIRFRIRQITDKERQTMINALSLSEGEEFYDNAFNGADQVVRENIVAIAAKNGWDFRKATEEYLGSLADNNPRFNEVKKIGLWDKVKGFFVDMLNKIGLNGFTKESLADNDLRYILWRRFKNPKGRQDLFEKAEDIAKQYELGVGDYAVTNSNASQEEDILFRNGDPQVRERIRVRDRYERRVRSGLFQSKEAIQDSMLSLKEAMQMIAGKGKKYIEDIADYMNAYLGENRLSSVNQAEVNAFARTLFKPMLDVVARLAKTESERVKLIDYMFAKHGLERNAHMRQEALNNGDANALNRDFAGLTALTGENNVADAEVHAQKMVDEYERTHNTDELWDKVNAVSKSILSKSYECGLMSKEAYDKVSNMYQYYIPLRGFDEKTSVEEYAYLNNKEGAYNAAIRKAEGRTSKADDPFANLESMAESTIMAGNRNQLVKQKFYNFVQNNPSDLVSVSELWLEYDNVNDEWKPVFPDNIDVNDTPQQVEQKLQAFEAKMEGLKQQYPDKYKHGKDAVGIPYRVITKSNLKEHQVVVKRNGRDIILTINGNPRLAQALNGMTNPDNDLSGAIGEVLRLGERVNRILSTNYTTRNPDFIVSNFLRDMLYSNIMAWIKESPKYALKFHRNYAKLNPAYMRMLYGKYRKGTLNMNNKTEAMFYQFIMNGGETGFSNIRDMEQHKKDIAKMLKKANGKLNASQAMDLLATQFDELNRSVENCARFAAFMTSREVGRTIGRSIYDAKEISVNFNKKGSGAKFYDKEGQTKLGNVAAMTSGLGRAGFAFWNASIQGTTNFGRQLKRHPAKAFTSLATMFILGAIVAYLGNDDDKDDKNAYYNIPENVRRSNIMFRAGDSWISIPLPIEFRAMYGMGELATTILSGKEHLTGGEIAEAITAQMSQILPLDFMEGDGGLSTFVPTALKPAWEVYNNESWTGLPIFKDNDFNKNMPDWTKAYKKANKQLVDLAATLNEISGGDKYTKGAIDINPAKIEYLLNGYFGGIFSTIDKLTKTAETIAGDREYDPRSILLWNRVVKSGDERTDFRAINNEYYRVKEEVQDTKRRLNGYERDTGLGIFDYAEKIDFIYNSPEYERYEIFMDYNKDIKKLMEELKEAEDLGDKEWAKDIETELNYLKQEMLLVMEHTYDRK